MAMQRLPIVGVMGSGEHPHEEWSDPLGRGLANLGVHLLTGGGQGVMAAVARAFTTESPRTGLSLGILPGDRHGRAPTGYPNPFVEVAIRTHLPDRGLQGDSERSRNHLNIATAQVVVVLPGGPGTASEARLALAGGTPVIGLGGGGASEGVPQVESVAEALEFVAGVIDEDKKKAVRSAPPDRHD